MKTLVRTISVFVVFALVTGCLALAKDTAEKRGEGAQRENVEEQNREARKEYERMLRDRAAEQRRLEELSRARQEELEASLPKGYGGRAVALTFVEPVSLGTGTPYSGGGRVLVIPAAQSTGEEVLTITEDMSVMSYIFDEKLGHSHLFSAGGYGGGWGGYGGYGRGGYFGLESNATQSIYLDGYGALFVMKVDFLLSPPPETPQEEKPEEGIDTVWQDAKRKIFEPERASRYRRRVRTKTHPQEYDAEKVEELKRKLIRTLKHVANIRSLEPDNHVILSVTGESTLARNVIDIGGVGARAGGLITSSGSVHIVKKDGEDMILEELEFSSPTVMTIRVEKAVIDAFSKGELDFDKFRKKVQIFTY